jgi:hypothetical protein
VHDTAIEIADNFCDQLIGYFVPAVSGNYVFFCNSDDASDLFLSTDSSASSRRIIAQETGAAGPLAWGTTGGTAGQERSDTFVDPATGIMLYSNGIPLIAGQKYFMQMVHHQGGGGTESCVTAKLFSDPDPATGTPSSIRGSQLGTYVPKCTYVTITNQPQSITVNSYASTTFTTGAATDSTVPVGGEADWRPFFNNFVQYQWYKNNTAVAGATTSAFAMPTVLPTDNNATFKCIMRALGYADASGNALWATSQVATLTVNVTAPQLLYAAIYTNSNYIAWGGVATNYLIVAFSTPMDPVLLSQMSSYTLPAGLTLLGVTVNSNDYRSVALSVSGTVTLPVNVSVSSSLTGLGGGLALSGATSTAVNKVPLTDADIGNLDDPSVPGMMYVEGAQAYTIVCEGSDIWNNADGFNFAYELKTNNFDVVVRQKHTTHTSNWAKGGLMVRETLDPASRDWNIVNDPASADGIEAPDNSGYGANAVEANARVGTGGASAAWSINANPVPDYPNAWVRLTRVGNILSAYYSTDGTSWTLHAATDPSTNGDMTALPSVVYVGICATAHNNDGVGTDPSLLKYVNTMDFDNYTSSYVPVQTITINAPQRVGSNLTITWTPAVGRLLASPALSGAAVDWVQVGTGGSASVPITGTAQFFRVANP